jgi:glucose dehydrogenase/plastocyanin
MKETSMRTQPSTDLRRRNLRPVRRAVLTILVPLVVLITAACQTTASSSSSSSSSSSPQGASESEWPQANHDYANSRAASGSTISSANVRRLGVGWTFGVRGASVYGSFATSPIVVGGTVYLQDLNSNVYALDLETGTLDWEKRYDAANLGPNGPAVADGRVFVTDGMQTVAALDASSGTQIWSKQIAPPATQGITEQLTVRDGTVYVSTIPGTSPSQFYLGGGMGIIHALDAGTGDELWSFDTVKNGNLWGNPKVNSGGGAWYPPAIDTSTGTTYWGIGNPAPYPGTKDFPNGSSRPGPNLYTDSLLALDASGQLRWDRQVKSHDLFDGDFQASPILTTATVGGSSRDIVIGSGKLGDVVAFDRQTGKELWETSVGLHHNDQLQHIPAGKTVSVAPGVYGGVETPMALADGVVFVPIVNVPTDYTASAMEAPDVTSGSGELDAIDVDTGKILWSAKLDSPDFGAALVAGDLVFTSTFSGHVLAFDRASGDQVWSWKAPGGINSPMAAVGDTLLVPVGLGANPMLVALRIGATGAIQGATPSPSASASSPTPGVSANTLQISTPDTGTGISYDTNMLSARAGSHVTVVYTNNSAIPHDWHLFDGSDASAPTIASTPVGPGPDDVQRVSFTVPRKPGRYYFQCDVHPSLMTGFLVVK